MVSQNMAEEDWSALLVKVGKHSDRDAFAKLFRHFAPLLKAFVQAGSATNIHAEEIVQEAMLKVWNRAGSFKPEKAAASTWIYTIARNTRIDMLRRQQKQPLEVDADDVWLGLEDEDSDPFACVQQKHSQTLIKKSLLELPQDQGEVLHKVYMEGKSHSEVASELALPLGTVKGRVRLALQKMRITLG